MKESNTIIFKHTQWGLYFVLIWVWLPLVLVFSNFFEWFETRHSEPWIFGSQVFLKLSFLFMYLAFLIRAIINASKKLIVGKDHFSITSLEVGLPIKRKTIHYFMYKNIKKVELDSIKKAINVTSKTNKRKTISFSLMGKLGTSEYDELASTFAQLGINIKN